MIVGIGCDLERVSAIEAMSALLIPGIVFTDDECAYAARQRCPASTLTGHFAAKEAFFKSLSGMVLFYWTDVEIVHDARRVPRFRFSGELSKLIDMKNWDVKLTIGHTSKYATAFVTIVERA